MYGYFQENDWADITNNEPCGYMKVAGIDVPFFSVSNEPESTDPKVITERFGTALQRLWELKTKS